MASAAQHGGDVGEGQRERLVQHERHPLRRAELFQHHHRGHPHAFVPYDDGERLGELPRLLRFLAAGTGIELVKAKLAESTGIDHNILRGYLPLLETVFLTRELPAWSRNPLGKATLHPQGFCP